MNKCSIYFAARFLDRLRGIFCMRQSDSVLMIIPCCSIHTCGLKRDIHVAFFDRRGIVIDSQMNVNPFRFCKSKHAYGVLEGWSCEHPEWFENGERIEIASRIRKGKD